MASNKSRGLVSHSLETVSQKTFRWRHSAIGRPNTAEKSHCAGLETAEAYGAYNTAAALIIASLSQKVI
jgi:hypothetical protein